MAVMDQDTRWMTRYNEVMTFIESNHESVEVNKVYENKDVASA